MGEVEMEAGLPEEREAVVAAREGSDPEVASVVPRFCKERNLTNGLLASPTIHILLQKTDNASV